MCIKDVFEQFLSEQESKLAPKTSRDYASVIELFEHQLDGYAWNNLADGDKAYTQAKKKGKSFIDLYDHTPTVSLGVTSAVVSSCGYESGQIEQRVAHELA